ncbi:c-type cytochrome [Methylocapsa aurea]|uniref:c-type cytochrome n=1 Tax=Methylocapsa aurea TaxID=663610 RepID=UPI00068AE719|nr:cytochrome c [Methylocapsa aurea]
MSWKLMTARRAMAMGGALILGAGLAVSAHSQTPPAGASPAAGPSPARTAIEYRKAVYTLIGANFRLLGNVLKGSAPYDAATVQKNIARLVFLSDLVSEGFPEVSNVGEPDTKAKADVWTNRADFDQKVKDFQTHLVALQQVNDAEKGPTEAFKTAAAQVGQDCKACHDTYKAK